MTQQPRTPSPEERIAFKRAELQSVRDLMCNHDVEAIRAEARADLRAAVEALHVVPSGHGFVGTPDPYEAFLHGVSQTRAAVLALLPGDTAPEPPTSWKYDAKCEVTDADHEQGEACQPLFPHSHRGDKIKWARHFPAQPVPTPENRP